MNISAANSEEIVGIKAEKINLYNESSTEITTETAGSPKVHQSLIGTLSAGSEIYFKAGDSKSSASAVAASKVGPSKYIYAAKDAKPSESGSTGGSSESTGTSQGSTAAQKLKKGTVIKVSGNTYVVSGGNTLTFKKAKSTTIKTIAIPATVKYKKVTYKVTAIAASAFSGYKKLTKVTIGKNVKKIGSKAFYNCKKLKTILINTSLLNSSTVGSKAFKGTYAQAKVTVPKAKKNKYKKFLISKGLNKKASIK